MRRAVGLLEAVGSIRAAAGVALDLAIDGAAMPSQLHGDVPGRFSLPEVVLYEYSFEQGDLVIRQRSLPSFAEVRRLQYPRSPSVALSM